MSFYASHYRTGEEILAGDRISWGGRPGVVLFVLGSPNVPEDWALPGALGNGVTEGFMLDVDGAGLVFEPESDEDLELGGRKS